MNQNLKKILFISFLFLGFESIFFYTSYKSNPLSNSFYHECDNKNQKFSTTISENNFTNIKRYSHIIHLAQAGIGSSSSTTKTDPQNSKLNLWVALIAALGAVVGTALTAVSSAYAARQKIREIELGYIQKLNENYLINARQYTNTLYLPIIIALSKLNDKYIQFRNKIDFETKTSDKNTRDLFRDECQEYLKVIRDLTNQGSDAFLTTELEIKLHSFTNFIQASIESNEVIIKTVLVYQIGLPFTTSFSGNHEQKMTINNQNTLSVSSILKTDIFEAITQLRGINSEISFNILGFGLTYNVKELIAAPIDSRQFEERFIKDLSKLKFLIKEVTLGKSLRSD